MGRYFWYVCGVSSVAVSTATQLALAREVTRASTLFSVAFAVACALAVGAYTTRKDGAK